MHIGDGGVGGEGGRDFNNRFGGDVGNLIESNDGDVDDDDVLKLSGPADLIKATLSTAPPFISSSNSISNDSNSKSVEFLSTISPMKHTIINNIHNSLRPEDDDEYVVEDIIEEEEEEEEEEP